MLALRKLHSVRRDRRRHSSSWPLPEFSHCVHRRHHHPLGLDSTSGLCHDSHHGRPSIAAVRSSQLWLWLRHLLQEHCRRSRFDLLECEFQRTKRFDGRILARGSRPSRRVRASPLFAGISTQFIWHLNRHSFIAATALRCECTANSSCSSRVMPYFSSCDVAGDAHVIVVVNVPQPAPWSRSPSLFPGGIPCAPAKQVRSVGHGFHATRDHDGTVSGLHRLRGESDCFQSGTNKPCLLSWHLLR